MKIVLLAVGKQKSAGGFREMERFYCDRIKVFAKIEIVELKEGRSVAEDTAQIERFLPSTGSFVVALREEGASFDSRNFAAILRRERDAAHDMVFVVGGPYGLGDIGEHLALSVAPWTLNHLLARIVLLEQIYRAFSILSGGKYHHA